MAKSKSKVISITDFSGGINELDSVYAMQKNQWRGYNWDITGTGKLRKRFGYDLVSSGGASGSGTRGLLRYNRTGVTKEKYLLIFQNGKAYTIKPDDTTWVEQGDYGTDTGYRVNGTTFANRAIFGDGTHENPIHKFGEYPYLVEALGASTYEIKQTISESAADTFDLYSQMSGKRLTSIILQFDSAGSSSSVTFTITVHDSSNNPVATSTATSSQIGGAYKNAYPFIFEFDSLVSETYHFHITTDDPTAPSSLADLVSVTSGDLQTVNIVVSTLSYGILAGGAPRGNIFTAHPQVLFISGYDLDPSVLYWSALSDPEDWTGVPTGNKNISKEDGQIITSFKIHNDQLVCFKEFTKYGIKEILDASSGLTGFRQAEITDSSDGTLSHNSVAKDTNGFIFYGYRGFQRFGTQENFPDRRNPLTISDFISPIVNRINKGKADLTTAIFEKETVKYYCACPMDNSDINDIVFVYNRRFPTNPWQVYKGMNPSDFEMFENENGKMIVHFGDELENKLYKFNDRFIDKYDESTGDGVAIQSHYRSPTFIPSYRNWFERIIIRGAMTDPCSFILGVVIDGVREEFEVTQDDIQWKTDSVAIGTEVIGHSSLTGESVQQGNEVLYNFLTEIHFPKTAKEGQEIYLTIDSNNKGEGLEIYSLDIYYELLSPSIIKPFTK